MKYGVTYERDINQYFTFETGLFYKPYIREISPLVDGYSQDFTYVENYVLMPLSAKLKTTFVDFTIGPTFEYFVGAYETKASRDANSSDLVSYEFSRKFNIGFIGSVGKSFVINDKMVFVPDFRINHVIGYDLFSLGFGLSLKFNL